MSKSLIPKPWRGLAGAAFLVAAGPLAADPALFDAAGYRIAEYRAPTPETAPYGRVVNAEEVAELQRRGAVLLDVMGLRHYRIAEDGSWLVPQPHASIAGAVWLPVVGWGRLEDWQQAYLDDSLAALTKNDPAKSLVVFCMTDCWLSWNVVKRLGEAGHRETYWFAGGVDAWQDAGHELVPVTPYPLLGARPEAPMVEDFGSFP